MTRAAMCRGCGNPTEVTDLLPAAGSDVPLCPSCRHPGGLEPHVAAGLARWDRYAAQAAAYADAHAAEEARRV